MKNKSIILICVLCLVIVMTGCAKEEKDESGVKDVTLVLDWTPNTNHTGFYVALEKGYFEEKGLNVSIVQPPEDGAVSLVASGKAQFGVDFQDYIAPAFANENPLPVTAVATLVQHNTSGIISLKDSGIDTPKGMSGKTYATWDLPVEKEMIRSVVEKDGGDFESIEMIPSTITDVVTALKTDIDAVWVFYGWDGIATEVKGLETDYFAFIDIIPEFDYYSPILIANNEYIANNEEVTKMFLEATAKGYEYAIENSKEAAEILLDLNPELDKDLVLSSQKWLANEYKSEVEQWGYIDQDRWDSFFTWLYENNLIEKEIPAGFGFTNDYLSK